MSALRSRVLLAAGMTVSLLSALAVAESSGATTAEDTVPESSVVAVPDTVDETSVTTTLQNAGVEILPPDETWGGMTRGELVAQWWQRATTMPEDISPYFDTTGERCGYQQSGPVFLLPGTFTDGMVERTCVVAEGTAIFVYVSGSTCGTVESPPYFARTEEEIRACASAMVEQEVLDFQASVNGQDVADLDAYLTTSPLFTITLPEDNPFGVEPGVGQTVAASYNFIIAPPPPGEYEIYASETIAGRPQVGHVTTLIVEAPQVIEPPPTTSVG